ncbi:hypothetical protein HDU83_002870 [Entophlyctis luteolus]|nr:hypothetical protein HDU83_002870 [Entophlyctis luteolus]
MSVNLVSFGEVLETEALFESFKQVALQNVINSSLVKRFNRIYLRFVASNAEYQVNISGASKEILDKMYACGRWKMNAFEEAKQEVVTSMVK